MAKPRTLYDKIWDQHLVHEAPDGTSLIYIDRHLVHEVTSPQAFEGLRMAGRNVRAPEKTLAVVDRAYLLYDGQVLREGKSSFLINDEMSRELYLGHKFTM